jgi:RNA polymerase sigma factor (sigma-70 family)
VIPDPDKGDVAFYHARVNRSSPPVELLVRRAADGDRAAFDEIVERFAGLVWAVARDLRLTPEDAADVSQTTWLRLVEHLGRIRQPERLAGWLVTTARNESFRVLRRQGRQVPTDDDEIAGIDEPDPLRAIRRMEDHDALVVAFADLPQRCQVLLRMLMVDPPPPYEHVAAELGVTVGYIGHTRGRCLDKLRAHPALRGIRGTDGDSGEQRTMQP